MGLAGAGSSSPSSAESIFREVDDVFLQVQARIWLGEVLNTRLDEQMNISDLLADGELLFEVSKVVGKMLSARFGDMRHGKVYRYNAAASKMINGRYTPYSNVDSFLMICKILGLNSIDLFSPSDVVEKRDIRRVCMCLRALSKKARSKHLNIPDFDVVTNTLSMPTNMVGCIRRSLELSRCNSSSSVSSSQESRLKSCMQKDSTGGSSKRYDLSSDESNNLSNHRVDQSHSASMNSYCNIESLSNLDLVDSSSSYINSWIELNGMASHTSNRSRHCQQNNVLESPYVDLELGNCIPFLRDFIDGNSSERSSIDHDLLNSESDLFEREDSLLCSCLCTASQGSNLMKKTSRIRLRRRLSQDIEDAISSTASVDSELDCEVNFDAEDDFCSRLQNDITHGINNISPGCEFYIHNFTPETEDSEKCDNSNSIKPDASGSRKEDILVQDIGLQGSLTANLVSKDYSKVKNFISVTSPCLPPKAEMHLASTTEMPDIGEEDHLKCSDSTDLRYVKETMGKWYNEDEGSLEKVDMPGKDESSTISDSNRRLALKAVLRGTVLFGVLFLFFQFRGSGSQKMGKENGQSDLIGKPKVAELSSQRGEKGRGRSGVYPGDNLKLRN